MTAQPHGLTRFDQLSLAEPTTAAPMARTFGRLLPRMPLVLGDLSHQTFVDCLEALAASMRRPETTTGTADAGMTFFGQFIDHDITRDAASVLGRRMDPAALPNVRTPALDLDSVYGDGPGASPYLYSTGPAKHFLMFGRRGNPRDFARTSVGVALIGDPRNDENIILSQIHGAFVCLHNILMTLVIEADRQGHEVRAIGQSGVSRAMWADLVAPGLSDFESVRRFIRLHYQWVVWNEFLTQFVDPTTVNRATNASLWETAPAMPIEFSGACYRFGHATAQPAYRFRPGGAERSLFATRGFGPRPVSSDLAFCEFFSMTRGQAQKARPVAPGVAAPLYALPFVTDGLDLPDAGLRLSPEQAAVLPLRNLLRDRYTYQLPSGQAAAEALGHEPLDLPEPLHRVGLSRTPLWYYSLQEAEERGQGRLTGVGGEIVVGVFHNLLKRDPASLLHVPDFTPWSGFDGQPSVLAGILDFVETYRGNISFADRLCCS